MAENILANIDPTGELGGEGQRQNVNEEMQAAIATDDDPLERCPPDFSIAIKHSDAHKVLNFEKVDKEDMKDIENKDKFWPWCKNPTSKVVPKYSLCTSAKNLKKLGLGFPLYYQLKFFMAMVYSSMIVFVWIPGVIINVVKNRGNEWVGGATPSYAVKISIGNYGKDPNQYLFTAIFAEGMLNLLFMFGILIASVVLRRLQQKIIDNIDESDLSPSDFCVMATGLPLDKSKDEVIEYIKSVSPKIEIVYVNFWYEIKEVVEMSRKVGELKATRRFIESYRNKKLTKLGITLKDAEEKQLNLSPPAKGVCCFKKPYPEIDQLIKDIEDRQSILKEKEKIDDTSENDLYWGTAFIIWNKKMHTYNLINIFYVPLYKKLINFLFYGIFRCKSRSIDSRYWEGQRVHIERASEPTDVYWENISVTTWQRIKKMSLTYLITFICLCVAFLIIFGLNALKNSISSSNKSTSTAQADAIRAVAIITSFIIVFINVVLGRIVRKLSAYENHETHSKYHLSVSIKLATVMFINTGILPLFVNWGKENWYDSGGLVDSIFYNTLSVWFVSPIFYYFNPTYLIQKIKMWKEKSKGKKSELTQRQANELFMGPNLDMAQRYANNTLLLLLVVFYSFPCPILPLMAFFGTIFQYWLEKYLLLRRHRMPEQMSSAMALTFSNTIPYVWFLYGMSIFIFFDTMSDGENYIGLVAFLWSIFFILAPIRTILGTFVSKKSKDDDKTYEKHSEYFRTDYDRKNPMTSKEAEIKRIDKLKKEGKINTEDYEKQLNAIKTAGKFAGVISYGQSSASLQNRVQMMYQSPVFGYAAMQPSYYSYPPAYSPYQQYGYSYNPGYSYNYSPYSYQPYGYPSYGYQSYNYPSYNQPVYTQPSLVNINTNLATYTQAPPPKAPILTNPPSYATSTIVNPSSGYNYQQPIYTNSVRQVAPAPQPQYYQPQPQYSGANVVVSNTTTIRY